jgi:hypothetical protein
MLEWRNRRKQKRKKTKRNPPKRGTDAANEEGLLSPGVSIFALADALLLLLACRQAATAIAFVGARLFGIGR